MLNFPSWIQNVMNVLKWIRTIVYPSFNSGTEPFQNSDQLI